MPDVVLYDIPSKDRTCWSLNIWNSRLALNYKGVDYQTEWVEYPDIAPTLKSFGIPARDTDMPTMKWTCPVVRFGEDKYVMDSQSIAEELERRYPTPPLHLDDSIVEQVKQLIPQFRNPLGPLVVAKTGLYVLGPKSQPYFFETRRQIFGKSLEEVEKEHDAATALANAKPALDEAAALLKKNSDGPFFLGKTVSYADFIFVGFLEWNRCADADVHEGILKHDAAFRELYEACKPWLARNN